MGQQVHDVQNSCMLYLFIIEPLTDTFKAQVLLYKEEYTVMLASGGMSMEDGPVTYLIEMSHYAHLP